MMKNSSSWFTVFLGFLALGCRAAVAQSGESPSLIPAPPSVEISYRQSAQADMDSGGEYARHDLSYLGEWPLIWDDPLQLTLRGDLRWTQLSLDNTPVGDLDLYKAAATLNAQHEGFYPLTVRADLSVGLLSDLEAIDGNDARLRGHFGGDLPIMEGLALSLGAAYDEAFGDEEWHLAGGLRWQPSPSFLLDLQYPRSRAVLAPVNGLAVTAQAGYAGDNWTIFYDKLEHNVRIKAFATELGAEAELGGGVWLRLFAGWLTEQAVDVWKGDRRPVKGQADDTYYGGVALLWR